MLFMVYKNYNVNIKMFQKYIYMRYENKWRKIFNITIFMFAQ